MPVSIVLDSLRAGMMIETGVPSVGATFFARRNRLANGTSHGRAGMTSAGTRSGG
jgi:hypothetical protein